MSATKTHESGQVLLEFVGSLLILVPLAFGLSSVVWAEWLRARCAVQVFEIAHAERIGARPLNRGAPREIRVTSNVDGLSARGRCGRAEERVELPWLE